MSMGNEGGVSVFDDAEFKADDAFEFTPEGADRAVVIYVQSSERLPLIRALLTDEERDALDGTARYWEMRATGAVNEVFAAEYRKRAATLRSLLGEE